MQEIFAVFGFSDYVISIIGLFSILLLMGGISAIFDGASDSIGVGIVLLSIVFIIFILPIYYFSIPNGVYQAKVLTKKGMAIGEGTKASKKFDFMLTDDKITMDNLWHYKYDKKLSHFYMKVYTTTYGASIKITLMGNVTTFEGNGEQDEKIKVFY